MKPRIFYVDDDQTLLELFSQMFGHDYEVTTFAKSADALAALRGCPADIVVSDLQMPEMNGNEFLQQAATLCPDSVRVMITGFATAGEMLSEVTSGLVQFFVPKPWDEAQMREVLERATARSSAAHR